MFGIAFALLLMPGGGAWGATVIDGPIDLGTAEDFGVLAASGVMNTGSSVIDGDLGVSPDLAITGFPPGLLSAGGTFHPADGVSGLAQTDLLVAMNAAASLTPTVSGLANLTGLSLVPGVYSGGELSLDGAGVLTLAGTGADDVWVFTAASTLITGSMSRIVITGGGSACNVFWRVGSSATFGTGTQFAGTVMAEQSITATSGTSIEGRLLAANAAVTLDTTTVTAPAGCTTPPGTIVVDGGPEFTSGEPTDATEGTPYAFDYTTTGAPTIEYEVTSGALPSGISLDETTGSLSGTPVSPGISSFTVTASNGLGSDASVISTLETLAAPVGAVSVAAVLPPTGSAPPELVLPSLALLAGSALLLAGRARRQSRRAL